MFDEEDWIVFEEREVLEKRTQLSSGCPFLKRLCRHTGMNYSMDVFG